MSRVDSLLAFQQSLRDQGFEVEDVPFDPIDHANTTGRDVLSGKSKWANSGGGGGLPGMGGLRGLPGMGGGSSPFGGGGGPPAPDGAAAEKKPNPMHNITLVGCYVVLDDFAKKSPSGVVKLQIPFPRYHKERFKFVLVSSMDGHKDWGRPIGQPLFFEALGPQPMWSDKNMLSTTVGRTTRRQGDLLVWGGTQGVGCAQHCTELGRRIAWDVGLLGT